MGFAVRVVGEHKVRVVAAVGFAESTGVARVVPDERAACSLGGILLDGSRHAGLRLQHLRGRRVIRFSGKLRHTDLDGVSLRRGIPLVVGV